MEETFCCAVQRVLARPPSGGTADLQGPRARAGEALERHVARLRQMGFQLHLRRSTLRLHHESGFDAVLPIGDLDEFDPDHTLWLCFQSAFGRPSDRGLPRWSDAGLFVKLSYESVRALLAACTRMQGVSPS